MNSLKAAAFWLAIPFILLTSLVSAVLAMPLIAYVIADNVMFWLRGKLR